MSIHLTRCHFIINPLARLMDFQGDDGRDAGGRRIQGLHPCTPDVSKPNYNLYETIKIHNVNANFGGTWISFRRDYSSGGGCSTLTRC